jgi:hypothetical protein
METFKSLSCVLQCFMGSFQVADLERQAMLGCKAGHSMLLDHLAASAVEEADLDCSEAPTLQVSILLVASFAPRRI